MSQPTDRTVSTTGFNTPEPTIIPNAPPRHMVDPNSETLALAPLRNRLRDAEAHVRELNPSQVLLENPATPIALRQHLEEEFRLRADAVMGARMELHHEEEAIAYATAVAASAAADEFQSRMRYEAEQLERSSAGVRLEMEELRSKLALAEVHNGQLRMDALNRLPSFMNPPFSNNLPPPISTQMNPSFGGFTPPPGALPQYAPLPGAYSVYAQNAATGGYTPRYGANGPQGSDGFNLSPPGAPVSPGSLPPSGRGGPSVPEASPSHPPPNPHATVPPDQKIRGGLPHEDFVRRWYLSNNPSLPHAIIGPLGARDTCFEGTPMLTQSKLSFMGSMRHASQFIPTSPVIHPNFAAEMTTYMELQSVANTQYLTHAQLRAGYDNRKEQGMLSDPDKDMMKSLAPSKFAGRGGPLAAYAHWMSFAAFVRARNQSNTVMVVEKWILLFSATFEGYAQIWFVRKSLFNGSVLSSGVAFLSAFHEKFIGLDFVRRLNSKLLGQDLAWGPSGSEPSHVLDFLEDFMDTIVQHSLCWVHMPQKLIAPSVSTLHTVLVRVFNGHSKDLMTTLLDNMRREYSNIMVMYDNFRVSREHITLESFLVDAEWLFVFGHTHLKRLVLERPLSLRPPMTIPSDGHVARPNFIKKPHTGIQVYGRSTTSTRPRPTRSYSAAVDTPSPVNADSNDPEATHSFSVISLDSCVLSVMNEMQEEEVQQDTIASIIDMFSDDAPTREHVLAIIASHMPFAVFTGFEYHDAQDPDDPDNMICQICALKTKDGTAYEILCWRCNKPGHFASQCTLPDDGILKYKPKNMSTGKGLGRWRDQPFGKAGPPPAGR